MPALQQILENKIVAIVRGFSPHDVLEIAEALLIGGVKLIEVTLNSPNAIASIKKITATLDGKIVVGAGTVLDAESAKAAIDAGAQFIISPSLAASTVEATKKAGAVSIPGAFTPTEILAAYTYGGDIIKVFPASVGPAYFKDLRGPFPHIPLMPTGGISLSSISEFQIAGAVAFGIGSGLVGSSLKITNDSLATVTASARKFVESVAR
jgi:2-dehydro-3-deoxyphosphogluconate aldolase/(4S)-4-hydroxy-2-oxoglutarate aldolase